MSELFIPGLATAARRLHLDAMTEAEIAECVLSAMDAGVCEGRAVTMALVDYLQRRGIYDGELRELVESGRVFQLAESEHDGRRNRSDSRRAVERGPRHMDGGSHADRSPAFSAVID